jgi:hypothetical protein
MYVPCPTHLLLNFIHSLYILWKYLAKNVDYFSYLKNCPKYLNNHPIGEKSPNLVTLSVAFRLACSVTR